MLKVVRKASFKVMKGEEINYEDFNKMIEFIRQYADAHHHGKEEKFLFKEMQTKLGKLGENLITHGMPVEHDFGRLYMSDLTDALQRVKDGDEESKLDVISNAIGYTNLLKRHISKENDAVYSFGETKLPKSNVSNPTRNKDCIYCTFFSVGINILMPCMASRGHSIIFTGFISFKDNRFHRSCKHSE